MFTTGMHNSFSPLDIPNCALYLGSNMGITLAQTTPINLDNATVTNIGGGIVELRATAHGFPVGALCNISGTTNYNTSTGHTLLTPSDANHLRFAHTYVAETILATATASYGLVSAIADQTPNARNASQTTSSKRPVYLPVGFNGHPSLLFSGGQLLDLGSINLISNLSGLTITIVASTTSTTGAQCLFFGSCTDNTAKTRAAGEINNTAGKWGIAGRRLDADGYKITEGGTVTTSATILTYQWDWANAKSYIYYNGTNIVTENAFQTAGSTTTGNGQVNIGGAINTRYLSGQIMAIVAWQSVLAAAQRSYIEHGFATRCGITVA